MIGLAQVGVEHDSGRHRRRGRNEETNWPAEMPGWFFDTLGEHNTSSPARRRNRSHMPLSGRIFILSTDSRPDSQSAAVRNEHKFAELVVDFQAIKANLGVFTESTNRV
jgi:hypothetical protein